MEPEEREVHESTRIVINGQEYHSLEEVPEEYRALLQDSDGDGVPDVLQGATSNSIRVARMVRDGKTTYTYNGQEYERIEELPAEARSFLERNATPGAAAMQAEPAHPVQRAGQRPEPPGQAAPPLGGSGPSPVWIVLAAVLATAVVLGLLGWMLGWF
jgi:hypothetical protein